MRAAEILVDDDLVHEIFIAASQRSRMFDDGKKNLWVGDERDRWGQQGIY